MTKSPNQSHDNGAALRSVELVPRMALRRLELAKSLGISGRAVDALIANRNSGLPILWVGTVPLFPVDDARRWLSEQAAKKR
jgi:hypothetical protein